MSKTIKGKHKILISAIAMLLTISVLSTTAFAEDENEMQKQLAGVTTSNGGGDVSINYNNKSGATRNDWAALVQGEAVTDFIGYRVYVVNSSGTIISKVVDLVYSFNGITDNKYYYGTKLSSSQVTDGGEAYIYNISSTSLATVDSTGKKLGVYKAGSNGANTHGKTFSEWMMMQNGNSTNAEVLMTFAFNVDKNGDNKIDESEDLVKAYLSDNTNRLVVEPILKVSIWTELEWIEVKETVTYTTITPKLCWFATGRILPNLNNLGGTSSLPGNTRIQRTDTNTVYIYVPSSDYRPAENCYKNLSEYSFACGASASDEDKVNEIKQVFGINLTASYIKGKNIKIMYSLPPTSQDKTLRGTSIDYGAEYNAEISTRTEYQNELLKSLGYVDIKGDALAYEDLTLEQKYEVYKQLEVANMLVPGVEYVNGITGTGGWEYTSANEITYKDENGKETATYGDYTDTQIDEAWTQNKDKRDQNKDGIDDHHLVSAFTGEVVYGTYWDVQKVLADTERLTSTSLKGSNGGVCSGYISGKGVGFHLLRAELGLTENTYGIHLYAPGDIVAGNPIHTINPIDPTPTIPDDPISPEVPKEDNDNTGESNIVKVYGEIYADDKGKIFFIRHKETYVQEGTTNQIVIQQEPEYKLVEWRESDTLVTDITATKWKYINSSDTLSTRTESEIGFKTITMKTSSSSGFTSTEDKPTEVKEGNTLYLLYLKTLPSIQTSGQPIPSPPAPSETTYPENPYNPTNPDKQGSYNIIKVYTILDQYDGTPKQHYTVYQTNTTPFILINNEPSWTLASWFTTNTTQISPAPTQIYKTATTQAELKSLYSNNYLFNSTSKIQSTIGTIIEQGTTPTLHYFDSVNSNTLYLFFTKLEGSVNYNATEQIITESYIAKRFSTLGYWWIDPSGTERFENSPLVLTVLKDNGTKVDEDFKNHLFNIVNPSLLTSGISASSAKWEDKTVTFKVMAEISTGGNILVNSSSFFNATSSLGGSPMHYAETQYRESFNAETMLFGDLDYRFTAYRKGDKIVLSKWKIEGSNASLDRADAAQTFEENLTSEQKAYITIGNGKSERTTSTELL